MKDRFVYLASLIFIIAFWLLYIIGIYHGFKKHDDNWLLNVTPFALYRGVEAFYHDDYASINWKVKNYNETQNAFYLINDYIVSSNPDTAGLNLEKFARRVQKYPSQHRDRVLSSVILIVKFYNTLITSYQERISDISNGVINDTIPIWYKSSMPYYDSLRVYYDIREVENIRHFTDSTIRFCLYSAAMGDYYKLKSISKNVNLNCQEILYKCNRAYKILSMK